MNATPWHPSGALCDRSSTPLTLYTVPAGAFAGIEMLAVVGAFASRLMFALAQLVVFVETGVPQLRPVRVTAYGLGFATWKSAGPAGPPGYSVAPAPLGVNAVTVRLWAMVAAPAPWPVPLADHTARATPVIVPATATQRVAITSRLNRLDLTDFPPCCSMDWSRCRPRPPRSAARRAALPGSPPHGRR